MNYIIGICVSDWWLNSVVKLKAMLEDRENTLAVLRTEKHRQVFSSASWHSSCWCVTLDLLQTYGDIRLYARPGKSLQVKGQRFKHENQSFGIRSAKVDQQWYSSIVLTASISLAAFKAQNLERCGTLTKTEAILTKCQSSLETEMARRNQLMAENTALTQQIDQYRNESIDMSGKMKDRSPYSL